jgi:hypothetical protein
MIMIRMVVGVIKVCLKKAKIQKKLEVRRWKSEDNLLPTS